MEKEADSSTPSWVDRMVMVPLPDPSASSSAPSSSPAPLPSQGAEGIGVNTSIRSSTNQPLEFNIASLNVLAESYLTPRSHHSLPDSYANVAFNKTKRRKLLLDTLERFCSTPPITNNTSSNNSKWDVLALQELDLIGPDHQILPAFEKWGYQVVKTPADQRRDCCAIAFDMNKFSLVGYEVVQFDDLSTLQSNNADGTSNENNTVSEGYNNIRPSKKPNSSSELTGMVRSFLRRNCAVLAQLKSKDTGQIFVVASVHLYWHPGYEYVKLCQAKYLLDRVASFASTAKEKTDATAEGASRTPTIICGDMNSKPMSIVHNMFVQSHVDARTVAPWRYFWDKDDEDVYTEEDGNDVDDGADNGGDRMDGQDQIIENGLSSLSLSVGGDGSDKPTEGGYTMAGFNADFNMYCGVAIEDEKKTSDGDNKVKVRRVKHKIVMKTETSEANQLNPAEERDTTNDDVGAKVYEKESDIGKDIPEPYNGNQSEYDKYIESRNINKRITPQDYLHATPSSPVKYMLDYTLNKFSRWLRILGVDAILETMEEEKERTRQGGKIAIFDHCKREQRTLLTTSYKLLLRKDCPPGGYLLDPKSSADLERALVRLLRTHGVELSPCKFLTRCVLCNGTILRVHTDEEKKSVFVDHGAAGLVGSNDAMEVFRCANVSCGQGYWWDDRSSSSASRVFAQATKLFNLCLRGGVSLKDETATDEETKKVTMGAFDFVDVVKERQIGETLAKETSGELSVIEWLREPKLRNPFQFKSAYASQGTGREMLPFTNVTKDFVGCLDYVFFEPSQFDQVSRLKVPTSFRDMNHSGVRQGHLIPSDVWPSDHIAVGARLRLKESKTTGDANTNEKSHPATLKQETNAEKNATPKPIAHPLKCGCGCVPNILSLHEMAALRKKFREEKKAAEAAAKLAN